MGNVLPAGLTQQQFLDFFALAHYGNLAIEGEFDLIYVPEPRLAMGVLLAVALCSAQGRRRATSRRRSLAFR
jgi:hypothetical protein